MCTLHPFDDSTKHMRGGTCTSMTESSEVKFAPSCVRVFTLLSMGNYGTIKFQKINPNAPCTL